MSGQRISIDIFIPQSVYDAIPLATKIAFRDRVRELKAKAVKINEGLTNEEATVKATIHTCYHDEDPATPCSKEIDI